MTSGRSHVALQRLNTNLTSDATRNTSLVCCSLFLSFALVLIERFVHAVKAAGSNELADELVQMARYGEEDDLKAVLAEQPQLVNHQNEFGQSALQVAAANGHAAIVAALLEKGANPNLQNHEGNSPLHWACVTGQTECVRLLAEQGRADVSLRNKAGRTPLDEAFDRGHSAAFDLLAEHSAVPGKKAMEEAEAENSRAAEEGPEKEEETKVEAKE